MSHAPTQQVQPPKVPSVQRERLDAEVSDLGITAADIVDTIHEPLMVLTPDLRVRLVEYDPTMRLVEPNDFPPER